MVYWLGTFVIDRKIPKICPGAYIFQRPFLKDLNSVGLIYGYGYTWKEICVFKSIGLGYSWKEVYVSNLQKGFTETRFDHEDVDPSKTQSCNYFVCMDRGNPSQE